MHERTKEISVLYNFFFAIGLKNITRHALKKIMLDCFLADGNFCSCDFCRSTVNPNAFVPCSFILRRAGDVLYMG